jgi:cytochrome b subunit of formate dehydrogenase
MERLRQLSRSTILEQILDGNNCPVARMRLFSQGVQTNNRIVNNESVTGDKGCLACGNCIDACPVVRDKQRFVFVQNQRTSMALENTVGDACRRCYACVRACPQVSKTTKEFVVGFRRGEKFVHAYAATLIFCLAASGIFLFHYAEFLPEWQQVLFRGGHTFAGFMLLLAPVLYWVLDRAHFKRALKKAFCFGTADRVWLKNFYTYLRRPGRQPLPAWTEFNTYHKIWFVYLAVMLPLMGVTGIVNLAGEGGVGPVAAVDSYWVHTLFALTTDLLVLTHIYFKLLRQIFRDISDMGHSFKQNGGLQYSFLYDPRQKNRAPYKP